MKRSLAGLLVLVTLAVPVVAQPLADHVPDDVMLYAGWAGADALSDAYAKSHLKPVIASSRIPDLFGTFLNDAEQKLVAAEPQAAEPMRLLRVFGKSMWKYPSALYFRDLTNWTDRNGPTPRIALICQAGADAPRLAQELTTLIEREPQKSGPPVRAFALGDVVCLSIGYENNEMALAGGGADRPKALSASPEFIAALKQGQENAATTLYIDVERTFAQVEKGLAESNTPPEQQDRFKRGLDASGLRGVKRLVSTSAFDGSDWVTQRFVEAPAPRTGLIAALEHEPLDAARLSGVPADASFVMAAQFDMAKLIAAVQASAEKFGPEAADAVDQGLSAGRVAFGTDLQANLFEPLGSTWVAYNSPTVNGNGVLGVVLTNRLDDSAKAKAGMLRVSLGISNGTNGLAGNSGVTFKGRSIKSGALDIYYFGLPAFSPSWAVQGDTLYAGLYTQNVAAAARNAAAGKPSITTNPKYQALIKRLGVDKPTGVTFVNLPALLGTNSTYNSWQLLARYAGMADLFGMNLPEPLLPPLDVLHQEVDVAGSVDWADTAGFHHKAISPFPGAEAVASEQGMLTAAGPGSSALMVSILLPSLNRAREAANRIKSGSNLSQIGKGLLLVSNDNPGGKYPDNFADLLEYIEPDVYLNPRASNADSAPLLTGTDAEKRAWINAGKSDYVYIGKGMNNAIPAEMIVAYEKPEGLTDGINVLFGDGHVEFLTFEAAAKLFTEQKIEQAFPGIDATNADGGL